MELNLPIYTYQHRSTPASPARLVNCYPEILPPGSAEPVMLTRAPGIKSWTTVGDGPINGMYAKAVEFAAGRQDYLYVVSGSKLYHVDSTPTVTLIGSVGTANRIDMQSNQTNICIVNTPRAYYWDGTVFTGTHTGAGNNATVMTDSTATFTEDSLIGLTIRNTTDASEGIIIDNDETTVTVASLVGGTDNDWDASDAYVIMVFGEIVDDDFTSRGSGDVEYLDKFYFHREPNSNRIFIGDQWRSAEVDTTDPIENTNESVLSYDALQFLQADDATDETVGMLADRGMMLLFGEDTIEMLENTGSAGVPFSRIINGTIEVGCLDPKGIARTMNQVFWVADDKTVRRLDGLQPSRVSTHGIENRLDSETLVEAFGYSHMGHFFYVLTTTGGTYLYDVMTEEWSERESYGYTNWNPRYHAQYAGKQLVGDSQSNKVGELDHKTYTDWGTTQRMEWTYQPIWAEGQRAFHNRLEIVLEAGVGATTGQGATPKIMLSYSDDGGKTWTSLPDKAFGPLGEYTDRCVWFNLGSARRRVYRAACSDPVPVNVTSTIAEVDGGRL